MPRYSFMFLIRDRTCRFTEHNPDASPPTKLSCGVADKWTLENLLLYSTVNGCNLDSSFRGHNDNRAPLTLVTTTNHQGHMVPGKSSPDLELSGYSRKE